HCARCIYKFIQPDFELSRRKNVVRVSGKTKSDRKEFVDPEGSSRSHTGEMRVHMIDPHLPQKQSNVDRLIESKEIGTAPPLIQGADNVRADLPFPCGASNVFQQLLFFRKKMNPFYDSCVPLLGGLSFLCSNLK